MKAIVEVMGGSYTVNKIRNENAWGFLRECFEEPSTITFITVAPRICRIQYGNICVETDEQEAWLRGVVEKTLDGVSKSQLGSLHLMR